MTNAEFSSIVEAYDDYFMSLYEDLHNPSRPNELPRQYRQRPSLYAIFNNKWEAEQYFNNIING